MRKIIVRAGFVLLVLGIPLRLAVAVDELPKPFAFTRYQAMMERSPFAVATAVAAPATAPNFAKDLYVANAAHSKEGDLVTIASSTDRNFKKYLTTRAAADGYSISNIEWSEKVGETKVTISKDGQTATLGFNEALLHQVGPGQNPVLVPPPMSQQQQQQQAQDSKQETKSQVVTQIPSSTALVVPQQNQTKPMPVPMLPTPPPVVRGVIPRNPTLKPKS